ncbi:sortase-dependent protein [Streptomyces sp. NPDC006235]|uniref:sortase-dependent protein n=1 Tax=Streptomyces sp. NPDC006235 TaxID=3156736 RepID=UPI0033BD53EB
MRRTVLTALALAGTAVLLGTGPAFASEATTPSPVPTAAAHTPEPAESAAPTAAPAEPTRDQSGARPAESAAPTPAPADGDDQVSVVPSGAPDTGVTEASSDSGVGGTAIGAGAAAVLALGGGTFVVVRRRRATGA